MDNESKILQFNRRFERGPVDKYDLWHAGAIFKVAPGELENFLIGLPKNAKVHVEWQASGDLLVRFALSAGVSSYFQFNYQFASKTRQLYREHLERLCDALQDPALVQIKSIDLATFMGELHKQDGQPYSKGMQSQIYRALSAFFNFSVTEGWLVFNPLASVKPPRAETGPKPRLTFSQIIDLLNAIERTDASTRNLAIVLLMLDCGLRKSEVVNLRGKDVFLEEGRVYAHSSKTLKNRDVPLSDMAAMALEAYLEMRPPFQSEAMAEPVFLLEKGPTKGQPLTNKAVEQLMKRLKKRLGFPLYAHLLRHTFGNHYIRVGGLKYLSRILGHSRIDTTARFYTDPDFEDIRAEIKKAAPTAQIF